MLIAEALIGAAESRSGLDHPDQAHWREGLHRLVRAFNEDAALTPVGEDHVAAVLVKKITNRLEVESWHQRHPEIAKQVIQQPVFGLGLPRTGSTALGVMLGQDPARRALRSWEAAQPCPPPQTATMSTDPRIAATQAGLDAFLQECPEAGDMIPMSANAATECLLLMSMDFRSKEFESLGRIGSYNKWLLECDMEPTYRFHRRALQLLQWRCPPNRWFLRTPAHSPFIGALDAVYPDARFVMTHRDVTKVIASNLTFVLLLSRGYAAPSDLESMARQMIAFWQTALRRLLTFRDAGNEHRFFDIGFAAFQSDPLREIRRFYEWLGEPLSIIAEDNMRSWWNSQSETRSPTAKIDLCELGISDDELARCFAFYAERFTE